MLSTQLCIYHELTLNENNILIMHLYLDQEDVQSKIQKAQLCPLHRSRQKSSQLCL